MNKIESILKEIDKEGGGAAHYEGEDYLVVSDRSIIIYRNIEKASAEGDKREHRYSIPLDAVRRVLSSFNVGVTVSGENIVQLEKAVRGPKREGSAVVGVIGGRFVLADSIREQSEVIGTAEGWTGDVRDVLFNVWYLQRFTPIGEVRFSFTKDGGPAAEYEFKYKDSVYSALLAGMHERRVEEVREYMESEEVLI